MSDFFSYVALALVGAFWVAVIIRIATKTYRNKHTSTKTVTATVVDKSKTKMFSRFGVLDQRYRCSVTFSVAGKRLSFFVPVATYDSYRLHTTGTLTYCGDKLIDFY